MAFLDFPSFSFHVHVVLDGEKNADLQVSRLFLNYHHCIFEILNAVLHNFRLYLKVYGTRNRVTVLRLRTFRLRFQVTVVWLRFPGYGSLVTVPRLRFPGYGRQVTVPWLRSPGYGSLVTVLWLRFSVMVPRLRFSGYFSLECNTP